MRKRFVYGSGVVLLVILATLVIWQVSFKFEELGINFEEYPENLNQTFIFWAVSTLVFVLTITLGFILFRTGIKLYIERRRNREGSRIESKLYFGALALSFMPVCFLVFFSHAVLNRQIEKWFFRPGENVKLNYQAIEKALNQQQKEKLEFEAAALADRPEILAGTPGFLERFCREQKLAAAEITSVPGGKVLDSCGDTGLLRSERKDIVTARHRIREGASDARLIMLADDLPLDIAAAQRQIDMYLDRIKELDTQKRSLRSFYIEMQ